LVGQVAVYAAVVKEGPGFVVDFLLGEGFARHVGEFGDAV
jgi:hypothetical protein